ncbi:unnamed protein product [Rotaria sp. Silwood1]|nr:unnamed protein product [Rotaria sp. Silwood1]CAF4628345.1 unnamed protein product [Rotaria sp. Silwood1]
MNCEQSELSTLLDDLWLYSDDVFYDFVKKFVGQIEGEILEIQHIKNVRILLQIPDIFSFFQINCKEAYDLKKKACFIDDDMNFIVREGIKCNIEQFVDLLKRHYQSRLTNTNTIFSRTTTSIEKNKSSQCICDLINIDGENEQYQSKPFINIFLSNFLKNMKRSKNNFQFHPIVTKFASVFRILAGYNAYEFIRINLLGSLPSDTTLKNYDENINFKLNECEFRFDLLKDYLDSIKSQYVFSSEDASGVVSSVSYDAINDSFIGFTPSLNNGLPVINQFKTNSYSELEQWFHDIDKSTLVNVHLIEPLLTDVTSLVHSRPYIISAYGINNKHSASDTIRRWIYIYNQCKERNINLVGFSTDCDSRYFKAMRICLGFFSRAPNVDLLTGNDDLLTIDIPSNWTFFFMRPQQLFLCMQDGTHLVTKIRNRLLSETATLNINNDHVDINHLLHLIENHPKLDHNLVRSDIFPHDKQNYSSCLKITSDDVLILLKQMNNKATYIYLYLLKFIILAYVKSDTEILSRLYFGWIVAFAYRIWWSSIRINKNLSQREKDNSFITRAAWLSSEINIHTLTFIIILVSKGRLPSYALNCHLFSSQPCESTFRSARSLSGSLSSITTFSVSQFINKIGKISMLNQIKSTEESSNNEYSLKFPRHHKNRRDESHASTNIQNVPTITIQDIEKIIIKAYNKAVIIMNNLLITEILKESNLDDIHKLSSFVFRELDKRSTVDYSIINSYDAYDSLDDDDDDNIVNEPSNIDLLEYIEESPDEHEHEEYNLTTSKQTFYGMKIYEKINSTKINNYFKITINNKHYYMHKQTAARLLTVNKNHLSSDRRFRVKQTSKQH